MRTNEEIMKLDFEQLGEWVDVYSVWTVSYNHLTLPTYIARGIYNEGSYGIEDIEILGEGYQEIDYDNDVEDIAELLLAGINYDANIKCETDLRYM